MNPISITVTGRLGDDPRKFSTLDGTDGVELRLAVETPAMARAGPVAYVSAREDAGA